MGNGYRCYCRDGDCYFCVGALMLLDQNNIRFQECSDHVIHWLHDCWTHIHDHTVEKLQPDPFYERNAVLTPEIVEKVIADIEAIFVNELNKYMQYHRNAQGISSSQILITPSFDKLPYLAQRCIVQGLDRILQEYRVEAPSQAAAELAGQATTYPPEAMLPIEYWDGC